MDALLFLKSEGFPGFALDPLFAPGSGGDRRCCLLLCVGGSGRTADCLVISSELGLGERFVGFFLRGFACPVHTMHRFDPMEKRA